MDIREETRLYELKQTGHFDLFSSDFGWWSCTACNQHGDDWTDPKDFACVQKDPFGIEYQI